MGGGRTSTYKRFKAIPPKSCWGGALNGAAAHARAHPSMIMVKARVRIVGVDADADGGLARRFIQQDRGRRDRSTTEAM